jgi:hypothetical protein
MLLKKNSDFGGGKKKSDSECLSYNLNLNSGKKFRAWRTPPPPLQVKWSFPNYEELLHLSKLPSLKVRRLRSIALETFKIINKNCPSYLYDLINI